MSFLKYKQAGFSMVELLLTLTLSSVLILGVTQIYLEHKRAYIFQQSQLDVIENSRYAVLLLDDLLSKAGYRRSPSQPMSEAFPPAVKLSAYCENFASESVITKVKVKDDKQQVGFCLRYQPAYDDEFVCDGSTIALSDKTPFVSPESDETVYVAVMFTPHSHELDKGVLVCITNKSKVEIMVGVADMHVEFGVGAEGAKRLKKTLPFTMSHNWSVENGLVRAVRYSLLIASRKHQRDVDSIIFKQWLSSANESAKTRLKSQDVMHVYQIATGSQALRNMMP